MMISRDYESQSLSSLRYVPGGSYPRHRQVQVPQPAPDEFLPTLQSTRAKTLASPPESTEARIENTPPKKPKSFSLGKS